MNIKDWEGRLRAGSHRWLITGVAGFIGSNLLEKLLDLNQVVVGLDNFSTGKHKNLTAVKEQTSTDSWSKFTFVEGDIRNIDTCHSVMQGVDYVLHQAAIGSVPRSLVDPLTTHESNINGFLNVLLAARDANVKRFVYAASSSTYGDHPALPKIEDKIGKPLSPYAVTKYVNELYAEVFSRSYGIPTIGLRYFNIFGPRQDPDGAYAAVIPLWFKSLIRGQSVFINGDGDTSRDFCFVNNAVQANLLAATTVDREACNQIYNVAVGQRTTLKQLYDLIRCEVNQRMSIPKNEPQYRDFRPGDVRHSLADISKAQRLLGYAPTHTVAQGLQVAADYYIDLFTHSIHGA